MKTFNTLRDFYSDVVLAVLAVAILAVVPATALPISVEIDSSQYSISDFDSSYLGNEMRIDYLVKNTSSFSDPSNAFKTIEISAGTGNTVYEALVPQGWTASIYEDRTVFSTGDHLSYIYPDQTEAISFSLFYENTDMITGDGQAMTPLGLWTDTVPVTIAIPEPLTIALFGFGAFLFVKGSRPIRNC